MSGKPIDNPKKALLTARIIWAALIAGQLAFAGLGLMLITGGESAPAQTPPPASDPAGGGVAPITAIVALIALLGCALAGYVARQQAFKKGWTGNAVSPQAYLTGTLMLLAPLEAAGVVAVVMAIIEGQVFPSLTLAGLAIAVQAMNFPTGSAMDETIPDLTRR